MKTKKEKKGIILELATHDINGNIIVLKAISIYKPYFDRYRLFIDGELKREILKEVQKIVKRKLEKWLV